MKEYQRKDVVFMCTMAGYLMDESKLDWENPLLRLQKQKLLNGVLATTDLMQSIVSESEFDKLHKEIKDGLYYCDVYTNIEFREYKKKSLKTRRKVDGESLFDLAEFAMDGQCNNCKRSKKSCVLRKALLKAGIPRFNEKRGQCEYLQGVE